MIRLISNLLNFFCLDVAQGRIRGWAPNKTRTHSCRFAITLRKVPLFRVIRSQTVQRKMGHVTASFMFKKSFKVYVFAPRLIRQTF